jgi:hypothetical protein
MLYLSHMFFILLASRLSKGRPGTGRSGSEGEDDDCRGEFVIDRRRADTGV